MEKLAIRRRFARLGVFGALVGGTLIFASPQPAGATDCLPYATSPGTYLGCVVNDQVGSTEQKVTDTVATAQGDVGTVVGWVFVIERCYTGAGC